MLYVICTICLYWLDIRRNKYYIMTSFQNDRYVWKPLKMKYDFFLNFRFLFNLAYQYDMIKPSISFKLNITYLQICFTNWSLLVPCGRGPLDPFVIIENTESNWKPPLVRKHCRKALSNPAKHLELNWFCWACVMASIEPGQKRHQK